MDDPMDSIVQDQEMAESSNTTKKTSPSPPPIDLAECSRSLLSDLGYTDLSQASIQSSSPSIPNIIFQYAFVSDLQVPSSDLLDALSLLVAIDGVSQHVLRRFRIVALDLLARWLEPSQNFSMEDWASRLCIVAGLGAAHPELWR